VDLIVEFQGEELGDEQAQVNLLSEVAGDSPIETVEPGRDGLVDPVTAYAAYLVVVGAAATVGAIAKLILALYKAFRPFTVIDLRKGRVTVRREDGVSGLRGQTLIVAGNGETATLVGGESLSEITSVINALKGSA
jgi:hypothetical protein